MAMSDAHENGLLLLIYNATTYANIAINATTSPIANIEVAAQTASPGDAGTMATSEVAYTSYARAVVARTSGGWTVTANSVSPVATIAWPAGTGGSGTITHFSTGKPGGGAAQIIDYGTVTPNLTTGTGITPQLSTATTISYD